MRKSTIDPKIIELLSKYKDRFFTPSTIRDKTGLKIGSINTSLYRLTEQGKVTRKNNKYRIRHKEIELHKQK